MATDGEKRAAYLAAKRMLAQPPVAVGLFDEPDHGAEMVRRGVLVRLVQRMEPVKPADVNTVGG